MASQRLEASDMRDGGGPTSSGDRPPALVDRPEAEQFDEIHPPDQPEGEEPDGEPGVRVQDVSEYVRGLDVGDQSGENGSGAIGEEAVSAARTIVLRQLAVQPRTKVELERTLRRKGVSDEVADHVLGRLSEVGLIDDAAFAHAWVESRHAGRGLARKALVHELRRRGVDRKDIEAAVDQLPPETELATARKLVDRKLASTQRLEPPARLRRLVGMLARKGYSSGIAMRAVREALADEDADALPAELAEALDAQHSDDLP